MAHSVEYIRNLLRSNDRAVAVLLAVMLLCQQWHSMLLQHEIHIVQQQVSDLLITLHSMD